MSFEARQPSGLFIPIATRAEPLVSLRVPSRPSGRFTLRVNLLEQCQFRCPYCRPGAVRPPTARQAWLTPDDYQRLGGLFSRFHVDKVRLTGGEPLLRPDVEDIIAGLKRAMPGVTVALTTNGQYLAQRLPALVRAGLDRATVHIDSLRPDRYRRLMGDADVEQAISGLRSAHEMLGGAKLNMVVQRGENDDELKDFLAFGRAHRIEVRFIELMNTGSARGWVERTFFSGREILARVGPVQPLPRRSPADPAALYSTADGQVFGLIASDTQPFCADCNRLRLMPDGRLSSCLYAPAAVPLGAALKAGATDAVLARLIDDAIGAKRTYHPGAALGPRSTFSMSETGG